MATVYDLEEAFKNIEDDLVNEIINGIKKTTPASVLEEGNSAVWKSNQLKALENFKERNKKYFSKDSKKELYDKIDSVLKETYEKAGSSQQKKILDAIEKGYKNTAIDAESDISSAFNGINDRKLNSLIKETEKNLYKAQTSAVRYAEDQYRQIIFNSNVYFNSGSGTLTQCIDKATKNFLEAGINNIEYKNGRRVNIQSYAEMELRTAEKRSYIQGEAKMRDEYGLGLVIVNRRGNACPLCMQFVGKIFNDDVYGHAKINPKYPLLSEAIANGLYHPNCKDVHTTYFEGITTEYPAPTKQELEKAEKQYALEQQQRYNERNIRKYKRLADGTLDEKEAEHYKQKVNQWQAKQRKLIEDNPTLRRKYDRESVVSGVKPSKKVIPESREKVVVFKKFESGEKANEYFLNNDKYKEWFNSLTEEQIRILREYTGSEYTSINGLLRGIDNTKDESIIVYYKQDIKPREKEIRKKAKELKNILDDFVLDEDIVVVRGMDYFGETEKFMTQWGTTIDDEAFEILKKYKGTIFNDKAFMSSSVVPKSEDIGMNGPIEFQIEIPKGKGRGAYIKETSFYSSEYEFLINSDSNLLVTDVIKDEERKKAVIKARLITD